MPRGIYFERGRRRWRVRLFYQQQLVWRSYHYSESEAKRALAQANEYRLKLVKSGKLKTLEVPPRRIEDLL